MIKELTAHSGRFSQDFDMIRRRSPILTTISSKMSPRKSGTINLSDLGKLKLPKIGWLEEPEEP